MNKNMCYIGIPKTATNSVMHALNISGLYNHYGVRGYEKQNINSSNNIYIAFFREPINRLQSWFYFHKKINKSIDTYQTKFEEWVEFGCPHHWTLSSLIDRGIQSPIYQYQFLLNDSCNFPKNIFIGDYDKINEQISLVCKLFKIHDVKLPKLNETNLGQFPKIDKDYYKHLKKYLSIDYEIYNKIKQDGFISINE